MFGQVICNLRGLNKILFIKTDWINAVIEQVLQMTMVLPTFPERKVGRTEG